MHEMDSVTVLLQDSISATERETLLSLYTMLQQNINSLAAADSSVTAAFKSGLLDAADAVLAGNNGVYPTMEFESNEKAVNEIFLKTIANETYTFTNDQLAILLNIINQCPFTGGTAVYRARGLYNLVNDSMQYDDFETCLQNGILLRQSHSALPNKVYRSYLSPNPASDVLIVNYELPDKQTGKIIFYDFLGIAKAEFILPEDQNQLSITAEYFTNGMYFYKIISNDQLVSEGKLAIIR